MYPPESKKKLKSVMPTIKNGWPIKFSLYQDTEVLVVFMSLYTHQVVFEFNFKRINQWQ